jgi:hypothetical protein
MPNHSSLTVPVSFRLPVEVYKIAERRVQRMFPGVPLDEQQMRYWINQYLKKRITYDILRKHERIKR